VIGHTDPDVALIGTRIRGNPVLGNDALLADCYANGVRHAVVGVGVPEVRCRLGRLASESGFELINAVHPTAILSPDVKLGLGVIVEAGVVLSDNPVIGDNVWVGLASKIAHDTCVGRDCLIGGGSFTGAHVSVGDRVLVGMGSVIGFGVSIGDDAIVGSGANVVHDVPTGATVVGNPAKVIGYRGN
jgi:UDP-perosamine 4-acetyltransferase